MERNIRGDGELVRERTEDWGRWVNQINEQLKEQIRGEWEGGLECVLVWWSE